jgi:hypothetical protein
VADRLAKDLADPPPRPVDYDDSAPSSPSRGVRPVGKAGRTNCLFMGGELGWEAASGRSARILLGMARFVAGRS